jgi:type IV pilus assembly protein PilC
VIYQEMLRASEPFVARGVRLTDIFNGSPELFPPVFQRMIGTGEQTGNLDSMLGNIAHYYQDDIEHWSSNFSSIIEPFLITFVGVVVGAIAVAILFPLWNFVNVIA